MPTWKSSKSKWKALIALSLPMLLSACASPIETVSTQVIVKLPPAGMLVPCDKPAVKGTWPEVITEDIPKLKVAVTACDKQIEDYLNWRAEHESKKGTSK
ncbi:hypothetical protein AB6C96_01075 [Vibrio cyclitrophicus]